MADINIDEKLLLEGMIGAPLLTRFGIQVPVDENLPIKFPDNIHYELYKKHVDFHVENSSYPFLIDFLKEHLPNNEIAEEVAWNGFGYRLKRKVDGRNIKELGEAIIELRSIVEPVLLRYCEMIADSMDLACAFREEYEKQKKYLPFHINVIDLLHADENAHTRILTQLLKYREDGKYTILKSFLQLLPEFNVDSFNIDKSHVYFNRKNIDGLIEKESEYAVIIENKIHWARDQDKQIERYVETEIKNGIPQDNIWVIYLTQDGHKKVENYSLTKRAIEILGSRFVELNYRHHILPWLKESILPNCRMKEEWLASAIKQYVDHLEGMFGTRNSQKSFNNMMQNKIAKSIGCTENMPVWDKYTKMAAYANTLSDLRNIVVGYMDSLVKPVVNRFQKETLLLFGEICPDAEVKFYNALDNGYFQILLSCWHDCIHFEWIPLSKEKLFQSNEYTLTLHVEGDQRDKMRKAFTDTHFCEEANHAGLKTYSDIRTFYRHTISTHKPIAEMSDLELRQFLSIAFNDVKSIYEFMNNHFLNTK